MSEAPTLPAAPRLAAVGDETHGSLPPEEAASALGRPGGGRACPLCESDGGALILRTPRWRVIRVTDMPAFPAFYRVVWNAHAAELSDLTPVERAECLDAAVVVERVLREHLQPTKINLAALGNVVPHLHWHVVARFDWDSHFPQPIWAAPVRPADEARLLALTGALPALDTAMAMALGKTAQPR